MPLALNLSRPAFGLGPFCTGAFGPEGGGCPSPAQALDGLWGLTNRSGSQVPLALRDLPGIQVKALARRYDLLLVVARKSPGCEGSVFLFFLSFLLLLSRLSFRLRMDLFTLWASTDSGTGLDFGALRALHRTSAVGWRNLGRGTPGPDPAWFGPLL